MSHPVNKMKIGEEQSKDGHVFQRKTETEWLVDTSPTKKKRFEWMNEDEAIRFYNHIN